MTRVRKTRTADEVDRHFFQQEPETKRIREEYTKWTEDEIEALELGARKYPAKEGRFKKIKEDEEFKENCKNRSADL